MKIVDRKTFLALPAETLFSKYEPCVFGDLCIKGETIRDFDFFFQRISDAIDSDDSGEFVNKLWDARKKGFSVEMVFDCQMRDGLHDDKQLFAVWEPADVRSLIDRLGRCFHNKESRCAACPVQPQYRCDLDCAAEAEQVMSDIEAGRSAFREGKPREGMLNESARIGWDEAAYDFDVKGLA